jgi:hypothetical protein
MFLLRPWVFSAATNFPKNAQLTVHLQGITSPTGSTLPTATWKFSTGTS